MCNKPLTPLDTNFGLPPLFVEWMHSFNLEEFLSPILRLTAVWTKRTSPTNASLDDLGLACMDLALWCLYLDDYFQEDYNTVFEKCSKILDGHQPAPNEAKLFYAYADIINRVAQRGYDMQFYLQARRDYLRCRLKLHFYGRTNQNKLSFYELFELRQVTVGLKFWTSLWEILGDFYLSPIVRAMPKVKLAMRAVSSVCMLYNDLHSLTRDIKDKTPNLVILYMAEYGGDIASTTKHFEKLIQQEANTFRLSSQSVLNISSSDQIRQYFKLLDVVFDYHYIPGLIENDNPQRYQCGRLFL